SDLRAARTIRKRELKKESIVSYIPFVIVLVLVVCFVGGMFKYQPIAVLSNSMYPTFSRGDAVIVEKINSKDINQLKKLEKGNILYFSKDGNLIIHRITAVEYESENRVLFHTKGDNNNSEDGWVVTNEEVLGTVKFMAPIVGYPSVLVNELLK
ncbi:MAG: signal peptidase I, partial [Bacilli bacterium]|nr:signal peptidase I [Bacilli bacterium]